jgi:D-amino-acid oxidase
LILVSRAGCNFSTISSSDKNALRWDRLGYEHLTRFASERPKESYVEFTPSFEYWEDQAPTDKIADISKYLADVRPPEMLPS